MNYIQTKILTIIQNSSLENKQKDFLIKIFLELPHKNAIKLLLKLENTRDKSIILKTMIQKFILISKINKADFLDDKQREVFKNTIAKDFEKKDLDLVLNNKDVDYSLIKKESEEVKNKREEVKKKLDTLLIKIKDSLNSKVKLAEQGALNQTRSDIGKI